jgi:hypothetical protein
VFLGSFVNNHIVPVRYITLVSVASRLMNPQK